MPWDLRFYLRERGDEPVREFLRALPKEIRRLAGGILEKLGEFGPGLRRPHADYLKDGIYELRFRWERVEFRILYFFDGTEVVLTNAFVKKTRRAPNEEIERAIRRRDEWRGT